MPDPVDDPGIPGDALLWRGVPPLYLDPSNTILPGQDFSSAAFKTDDLSMYLIAETSEAAIRGKLGPTGHGHRFRELTAKVARDAGYALQRVPDAPGDTSHVLARRADPPGTAATKGMARKLKVGSWWADEGPPVPTAAAPP